jgi:1-aminocyclopropane-1-carboxylate deaminase/D-cysteine desulfhydrase-like pyridoxal-dependent ACC family enzyme
MQVKSCVYSYISDENVVFLHTGGWPALFAYKEELAEEGAPR